MGSLDDRRPLAAAKHQLTVLPQGNYLLSCMTTIRNVKTGTVAFVDAFEIVAGQLITAALDLVPTEPMQVVTPTGCTYSGCRLAASICGVSILRAGASFERALRRSFRGPLSFGMLLIQRDEATSLPEYTYSKLPSTISSSFVLILEPMLATGGTACKAVEVLKESGVPEANIVFVNLIASRHGLNTVMSRFPEMKVVTAAIDEEMTASNHVKPGLGDFGDRFYRTNLA